MLPALLVASARPLLVAVALAPAPSLSPPSPALASVKLPEIGQLVRAVRSGDDVEVERVAARLGAVRLERVAERGRREERLAALRGLSVIDDGWYLLPDLVRLLDDHDADLAEAAGLTVRQIAAGLSPESMFSDEVPRDVPARAAAALSQMANRAELRPSVRVAAIAALASLRAVTRIDEPAFARLFSDGEPQVRRAAAEGMSGVGSPSAESALSRALENDAAAEVAAAAAATLCRDLAPTGNKGAAFDRAARLSPRARDRLRQLAVDEKLPLVDRLDLLGCLRVNAQPPDQKVLDLLARAKLDAVRRRARSLGGR